MGPYHYTVSKAIFILNSKRVVIPLSLWKQSLVSRSSKAKLWELILEFFFYPEAIYRISFEPCLCWPQRSKLLPYSWRQYDSPSDCLHSNCSFHLPREESLKSDNYCGISQPTAKRCSSPVMLEFVWFINLHGQ